MNIVIKFIQIIFLGLIKAYQYIISPLLPPSCRFTPTCSEYAKQCIIKFGPVKGCYLSLFRLLKCNPFGKYGYDPVPNNKTIKEDYGSTTTKL